MKKIFIIENQQNQSVWSQKNRSVIGIEIEDKALKIRKLKGIDVTLEGFLHIIQRMSTELSEINNGFKRISPYKMKMHEGFSGCRTWEMSYLYEHDGFWIEKKNEILYVSCFGKVPDQDIFIPDLALIILDLVSQSGDTGEIKVKEVEPIEPETTGYICP